MDPQPGTVDADNHSRPRRKKSWKKRLQKRLALTLIPYLASKWLKWFDRTACRNHEADLTLERAEELLKRVGARQEPSIIALWHNRLVFGPTAYSYMKGKGAVVMVSQSFDGEVIAATLGHFPNLVAVRGGSSSKPGLDKGGQEALNQMVEYGKQGYDLVITPDGPQGPVYEAKRGVVELARASGLPIYCIGANANKHFEAKSWDKTRIPFPYARFIYVASDPITVPPDADDALLEAKRQEVEKALRELTDYADHFFEPKPLRKDEV